MNSLLPTVAIDYFVNVPSAGTKHLSQSGLGYTARRIKASDAPHFVPFENRAALTLARRHSALGYGVVKVILVRSNEQVLWIYTRSHIAFMAYLKAVWNRPEVKNPRCAVRNDTAVVASIDFAVSRLVVLMRRPEPASSCPLDLPPKSFSEIMVESWWKSLVLSWGEIWHNWSMFIAPTPTFCKEAF